MNRYNIRDLNSCKNLSLYIHIPFCIKKCTYCDFFSADEGYNFGRFADDILSDLDYFFQQLEPDEITSVYIGGGTPSLLGIDRITSLCSLISRKLPHKPVEWTIEANPEHISLEFIRSLRDTEINRLSVGIQSFHDKHLSALGRPVSAKKNFETMDILASEWPKRLNIDIISGIPCQNSNTALKDIESAINCNVCHISLYELTYEPGTVLFNQRETGLIPALSHETKTRIYDVQKNKLLEHGYDNYEISNYAKPGDECLHNIQYWQMRPYLGIGPSAVSTIPGRYGNVLRLTADPKIRNWNYQQEKISPKEFLFEHFIMGFRMKKGIEISALKKIFKIDLASSFPGIFDKWTANDGLFIDKGRVGLTPGGQRYLNIFLQDLLDGMDTITIEKTPDWPIP